MGVKNKKHFKIISPSGFTLVEVMVAVAVLSVGLIGAANLITYNISNSAKAINKTIAMNLAQEGIELVRNIRDTNWLQGKFDNSGANSWDWGIDGVGNRKYLRFFCGDGSVDNITSTPTGGTEEAKIDNCGADCQIYAYSLGSVKCYSDNFGGSYGGYSGVPTNFYRLTHIEEVDSNSNIVNVTVKWIDRGQNHYLTMQEILYNWKGNN